jgi:phosphoribosylglycinamide formyltransferase-1
MWPLAERTRIAVLLSGRGSNYLALQEAISRKQVPADVALVVSNNEAAAGLDHARRFGVATAVVPNTGRSRQEHEAAVLQVLDDAQVQWICLAGYMRLLSPVFVERYRARILNIHPSLLPAFPGLHVHEQALAYGVKVSGCTVHLVDEGTDTGPIVVQRTVEVRDSDSPDSLAARILEQEHLAYPEALRRLLTERWQVVGRRIVFGNPLD